jgi:hypothetical protein
VYFYGLGYLLNHYSPAHLYDFPLQISVFQHIGATPPKGESWGPFAYPPQVAILFQPLANLPFMIAGRIWQAISVAAYMSGLWLLLGRFCPPEATKRSLWFCFGLLFWPFVSWILIAGQLSAIGFAAMALALRWEDDGHHFSSGLALSVCTYKPTLLILILPMLAVIGRWRTLTGFATGSLVVFACGIWYGGLQVWRDYITASGRYVSGGIPHVIPARLDLKALMAAVPPDWQWLDWLFVVAGGAAVVWLAFGWRRFRETAGQRPATLIWITTVTWTLLLNVYVPVYDSVLAVGGLIASAEVLRRLFPRMFLASCLTLLVCSYVSTWLSGITGWQLLTPVLAAIGCLQMFACLRQATSGPAMSTAVDDCD